MELKYHRFELPLRHPFGIARGTTTTTKTLIVELSQDGHSGYGEMADNDYYGVTIDETLAALEGVRQEIADTPMDDPAAFWEQMNRSLDHMPFVQCALDEAACDLWGKLRGETTWKLWGLSLDSCPLTDYTIGIDTIEVMVKKLKEFDGWPIYKIKLGTSNDLEIVRALREHTDAVFRVDANCGWTADEAIANSQSLKDLGVEFIEQPLPADQWDDMKRVYRESALPVIADESCRVPADVDRCEGHFHGINIKLMKCGGLTPARGMIDRARQLDLKVMIGCMTETTVGISAIAQLLPQLDYVDMDGALLLAEDVATGVTIDLGRVSYPDVNGNGVRFLR
ncbi:MAG: dipeptide epimerase [Pirellulales bacterium]|nr:dipeptide epimerase [Pirellulales bacterium]